MSTAKMCHCDWLNQEADWPIAEINKVRWESQIENVGKEKGRVRGVTSQAQREKEMNVPC